MTAPLLIPSSAPAALDPLTAVTAPDPYPFYTALVRDRPLAYDAGLGLWVAASAEAVAAVLASPAARVRPVDEPVPRALVGTAAGAVFARLVRMNDGERHCPWKAAISGALAGIDRARLAGRARSHAEALLGEEAAAGAGDGARVDAVAFQVPALALAGELGFPEDTLPRTASDAGDLARSFAPGASAATVVRGSAAAERLLAAADRILDDPGFAGARKPPGVFGGPLAALARHAAGMGRLDAEARAMLIANAVGLLHQVYEATAGLIGNTLLALAREPAAVAARRGGVALGDIVREVARFDSPVHNTRRFFFEPTSILGQTLAAGDAVLVVLAAANRDPAANAEPARFDPRREAPRSFTFGHSVHACPGEALASTLAATAVATVLDAGIDPVRIAAELAYRPSLNTRVPLFGAAARGTAA